MQKRFELGLPLLSQQAIGEVPAELQQRYQQAYVEAAREVGELLLADGNIQRAWPYFRAIGDTRRVSEALQTFTAPGMDTPDAQETVNSAIKSRFRRGESASRVRAHPGAPRAVPCDHHVQRLSAAGGTRRFAEACAADAAPRDRR
jgi:hypothetical protein